jgi:hypothetical protein
MLDAANRAFHDSYNHAVQQIQDKLGTQGYPVLLIEADLAVLLFNGKRYEANILPEMYHSIKAVSHLPFGTYNTLAANGPGSLIDETVLALENQMLLAESLIGFAEQLIANPAILAHYANRAAVTFELLRVTVDFIAGLLQKRRLNAPALNSFAKKITPLFMEHVAIAAALELDVLHKQVSEWRELMGESEWRKLFVVISLGHQARYREVSSQYFHRLVHERESVGAHFETRIVHAESIWDEQAALKLLARHQVDSAASLAFFDNPWRLQEDLMSDAASTYLAVLLPD